MSSLVQGKKVNCSQPFFRLWPFPFINISITSKMIIFTTLMIVFACSITICLRYTLSTNAIRDEIRSKLTDLATSAALLIDGDKLERLSHIKKMPCSQQKASKDYMEIYQKLQQFKAANQKIKYVYTMTHSEKPGYLRFLVDAAEIDNAYEHSNLGDVYEEKNNWMLAAFSASTADADVSYDKWGGTISGYAPVKNSRGMVVGIVGIDMTVDTLKKEEASIKNVALEALGISIFIALFFGLLLSRYFMSPVEKLTSLTQKVATGDFETKLDIDRSDEFGTLANSFNIMVERLLENRLKLEDETKKRIIAERLAAIGEVTARIVHDLKNPLTSIKGFSEMIAEDIEVPEGKREYASMILEETDRLADMLYNILDFSKEIKINPVSQDLNKLLDNLLRFVENDFVNSGLKINKNFDQDAKPVMIDYKVLWTALLNIIENAKNAMQGHKDGVLNVTTKNTMEFLELVISDNGSGIPVANIEKIFEPFFTTKVNGTGLGLANVKKIIDSHGVEIIVESRVAEDSSGTPGTKFFLRFPHNL